MVTKNRMQKSSYGTRLLIGLGEEADVFRYLDGRFSGIVARVPRGEEHQLPNTVGDSLLRYRRHQIAYTIFPQHNINVIALDLCTGEMYSYEVYRSKENLRHATATGVQRRSDLKGRKLSESAVEVIRKMEIGGVYVHTGIPNVTMCNNGYVVFFEVVGIEPKKALETLYSSGDTTRIERGKALINAFQFESNLPLIDIDGLFTDPEERSRILETHGKIDLAHHYESEIGSSIFVDGFSEN